MIRFLVLAALFVLILWVADNLSAIRGRVAPKQTILNDKYTWRDVVFSWPGIIIIFAAYFALAIVVIPKVAEWLIGQGGPSTP